MTQSTSWVIIGVLVFAALAFAVQCALALLLAPSHRYSPRAVMTPNEMEFFTRLQVALGSRGHVFPQVAMSAIVEPKNRNSLAAFRAISQKRVDYTVHANDLSLICVVELDDRTHNAANDAKRDRMLATAGIPTLRWESKHRPTVAEIRSKVGQALDVRSKGVRA